MKQQDIGAIVRRSLKKEKSISGSLVSSDFDKESGNDENGEEDDKPNANAGETKSKKGSSINHRGVRLYCAAFASLMQIERTGEIQ